MIAPVCINREIVDAENGKLDGQAVVLECPVVQGLSIVWFIWDCDRKAKRYLTRAYAEGEKGGWRRVTKDDVAAKV